MQCCFLVSAPLSRRATSTAKRVFGTLGGHIAVVTRCLLLQSTAALRSPRPTSSGASNAFYRSERRWLSTADKLDQLSSRQSTVESWEKTVRRVLNIPVGAMEPHDLKATKYALLSWDPKEKEDNLKLSWRLLDRYVEEMRKADDQETVSKRTELLNAVVRAWRTHPTSGPHPIDALDKIDAYGPIFVADEKTLNMILHAIAKKVDRKEAPLLAESVLDRLLKKATKDAGVMPDIVAFNTAIHTWAKSGLPDAHRKAEAVLEKAYALATSTGNSALAPNTVSFTTVLDSWAKSRDRKAPERAEAILRRMLDLYEGGMTEAMPNLHSFNATINCWAKSGRKEAGGRAEELLKDVLRLASTTGNDDLKPDVITFTSILDCIAKSGKPSAPERAEALLLKMSSLGVDPNVLSYTTAIHCWAKSGRKEASDRAEAILNHLLTSTKTTNRPALQPNIITVNSVLHCFANCKDPSPSPERAEALLLRMADIGVMPNVRSYNIVIDCWTKSGRSDAARRAEDILNRMMELSKQQGKESLRPNVVTLNSVLGCISTCGETSAPERVQAVLLNMMDAGVMPDVLSYSIVINSWAHSGRSDASLRAENILNSMLELSKKAGHAFLRPNTTTFNCVLHSIANSNESSAPRRAEGLLSKMPDEKVMPDVCSYNTVINCWAKSAQMEAADRAEAILRHMQTLSKMAGHAHLQPNTITYNSTMNAIARSGHHQAGERALRLLNEMKASSNPKVSQNRISCSTALKAISKSRMADRNEQMEQLRQEIKQFDSK